MKKKEQVLEEIQYQAEQKLLRKSETLQLASG